MLRELQNLLKKLNLTKKACRFDSAPRVQLTMSGASFVSAERRKSKMGEVATVQDDWLSQPYRGRVGKTDNAGQDADSSVVELSLWRNTVHQVSARPRGALDLSLNFIRTCPKSIIVT